MVHKILYFSCQFPISSFIVTFKPSLLRLGAQTPSSLSFPHSLILNRPYYLLLQRGNSAEAWVPPPSTSTSQGLPLGRQVAILEIQMTFPNAPSWAYPTASDLFSPAEIHLRQHPSLPCRLIQAPEDTFLSPRPGATYPDPSWEARWRTTWRPSASRSPAVSLVPQAARHHHLPYMRVSAAWLGRSGLHLAHLLSLRRCARRARPASRLTGGRAGRRHRPRRASCWSAKAAQGCGSAGARRALQAACPGKAAVTRSRVACPQVAAPQPGGSARREQQPRIQASQITSSASLSGRSRHARRAAGCSSGGTHAMRQQHRGWKRSLSGRVRTWMPVQQPLPGLETRVVDSLRVTEKLHHLSRLRPGSQEGAPARPGRGGARP